LNGLTNIARSDSGMVSPKCGPEEGGPAGSEDRSPLGQREETHGKQKRLPELGLHCVTSLLLDSRADPVPARFT